MAIPLALKTFLVMLIVEVGSGGISIVYKMAAMDGMRLPVIIAYRYIFAAVSISPFAFFIERGNRPNLTWKVFGLITLCGLFGGAVTQNLYVETIHLTSATFTSAVGNFVPAVTFILAVCFRSEAFLPWKPSFQAKVVGTLLGFGGTMLLTFYKGVVISFWPSISAFGHPHQQSGANKPVLGAITGLASCTSYGIWLIIQAKASELYPCPYSVTAIMCTTAAIISTSFTLIMDHDWESWRLGWNIRLLTGMYSGFIGTSITVGLQSWVLGVKGPVYVASFMPLMTLSVAIMGSLFLDEKLYMGSALGSLIIIIGLYAVMWGKAQDAREARRREQLIGPGEAPVVL